MGEWLRKNVSYKWNPRCYSYTNMNLSRRPLKSFLEVPYPPMFARYSLDQVDHLLPQEL